MFLTFPADGVGVRLLVDERHPQWLRSHVIQPRSAACSLALAVKFYLILVLVPFVITRISSSDFCLPCSTLLILTLASGFYIYLRMFEIISECFNV